MRIRDRWTAVGPWLGQAGTPSSRQSKRRTPIRRPLRLLAATSALLLSVLVFGCDTVDEQLRSYESERPFIIRDITQSWSPDVQWVGGRAAAIGVNRGSHAALDSTLVWMRRVGSDEIDPPISINENFDSDAVAALGGQPTDSLGSGGTYTVWIASEEALAADLDSTSTDEFSLVDSTFQTGYLFAGRSFGGVDVDFSVVRDESLTGQRFLITWTPADVGFRQLAIRDAGTGGFTNLLWHIVIPDDRGEGIHSPLVIGAPPDGAIEATEWAGWADGVHTIWATNDDWDGSTFGFTTRGYAFFQALASNFE